MRKGNFSTNNISSIETKLSYFQFGPIIAYNKLSDDFISELSKRGDKTNINYRHQLAGHIENENAFSLDDKGWFIHNTKDLFLGYVETLMNKSFTDNKKNNIKGLNLDNLWINFMKAGEFNPLHFHGGDISFVIYTSVPEKIISENSKFTGIGSGPGCISFYFGEHSESYKSSFDFLPKKGNTYIFPACLRHSVPPFKSNVTRVSVSGNIKLT